MEIFTFLRQTSYMSTAGWNSGGLALDAVIELHVLDYYGELCL